MITTTKEEIRKAVMEALLNHDNLDPYFSTLAIQDFPSVADLVAETLGETEGPQWTLESPDYWAESVKMADELGIQITYEDGKYKIFDDDNPRWSVRQGPFTLPELHEKLISLRESEGE